MNASISVTMSASDLSFWDDEGRVSDSLLPSSHPSYYPVLPSKPLGSHQLDDFDDDENLSYPLLDRSSKQRSDSNYFPIPSLRESAAPSLVESLEAE